ncbi:MAG: hypothetical protein ACOC56_02285 [Atribacterota bacterium]
MNKTKTEEELERKIEEQTKNLINWEGKIIIEIKGKKFNVIENHDKFVEITILDRNKAKLSGYKLAKEEFNKKIKQIKEILCQRPIKNNKPCDICINCKEINGVVEDE